MNKLFFIVCIIFSSMSVASNSDYVLNYCTNKKINVENIIRNQEVSVLEELSISQKKLLFFIFSYLNSDGYYCENKRYDSFVIINDKYLHLKNLMDGAEYISDLSVKETNNGFVLSVEYGANYTNFDKFYFKINGDNIYLSEFKSYRPRKNIKREFDIDKSFQEKDIYKIENIRLIDYFNI